MIYRLQGFLLYKCYCYSPQVVFFCPSFHFVGTDNINLWVHNKLIYLISGLAAFRAGVHKLHVVWCTIILIANEKQQGRLVPRYGVMQAVRTISKVQRYKLAFVHIFYIILCKNFEKIDQFMKKGGKGPSPPPPRPLFRRPCHAWPKYLSLELKLEIDSVRCMVHNGEISIYLKF